MADWISQAVEGSSRSGVAVVTIRTSMSAGVSPALSRARCAARSPHLDHAHLRWRDPALHNARAFPDPGVAGVDHALEIGVGQHVVRQESGGRRDACQGLPQYSSVSNLSGREIPGHVRNHAAVDGPLRHADGLLDRLGRRRTVTDDAHAVHAQQRHTSVLGVVESTKQFIQPRVKAIFRQPGAHGVGS